jgi:hypothetical protein
MKEDSDLSEGNVRKKQPELVLKKVNVLEMKEDPDLTEGIVGKKQPELVLKEDNSRI